MASRHPDRMIRADLALNASFNRGDASDRSMYSHTPTLNNGAAVTAGNRYATFDGVNDFLSFPDHDALSFTNGSGQDLPFSICGWVYVTSSSNNGQQLVCKITDTATAGYEYYLRATIGTGAGNVKPQFALLHSNAAAALSIVSSVTYSLNTWTFIAATYSGSEANTGLKIFVNGVEDASPTRSTSGTYTGMSNTTKRVLVGTRADSGSVEVFTGNADDIRIYNRELTAAEVAAIYSSEKREHP